MQVVRKTQRYLPGATLVKRSGEMTDLNALEQGSRKTYPYNRETRVILPSWKSKGIACHTRADLRVLGMVQIDLDPIPQEWSCHRAE